MNLEKGIVRKSTGNWYHVLNKEGQDIRCRIVGKFRLDGLKTTNPVAVGDEVEFEMEEGDEETGVIRKISRRENYIIRQSPRKKHQLHILASNVDQAVVITTIVQPLLKQGFIDRFLMMTEPQNIPAVIVFNKADVYEEENLQLYEYLKKIYESIGYKTLLVSATERTGLEELKEVLKDKTTLIGGQSGVGKSTLVNSIQPQLELRTEEISDYSGKGQHTTTFAEMFELDFGGSIIDTPGIKNLSFSNLEPQDVTHNFREFFEVSKDCKFGNCTHRNEPKCAVKEAIEEGTISELRYFNYITILDEVEDQNYWERHRDM
ncbi:MAG: ribosome small subunit-dependent GTPase A [Saprospiraceae bacterium]